MDNIQILQECYSRVTLIPVVGSGLSIPMGLPSWRELIEKSADYFSISDEKKESGSKESGRAEEVRRNIEKQSCDANFLEALIDEAAGVTTEYEDKFKAMGLAIKYVRIEKEKS